jgi:hypothetical protein
MPAYWKLWFAVLDLGFDAQRVIALRLAKIAAGGAAADIECRRMVSEKFATAAAAQAAAAVNSIQRHDGGHGGASPTSLSFAMARFLSSVQMVQMVQNQDRWD